MEILDLQFNSRNSNNMNLSLFSIEGIPPIPPLSDSHPCTRVDEPQKGESGGQRKIQDGGRRLAGWLAGRLARWLAGWRLAVGWLLASLMSSIKTLCFYMSAFGKSNKSNKIDTPRYKKCGTHCLVFVVPKSGDSKTICFSERFQRFCRW